MPELPVLDPTLFGMPESPGVPADPQQDFERDHPEISQHAMAQQQDLPATNPPGTFAQPLLDGVNQEPGRLAAGLDEGMEKIMKKIATVPNVKPPSQGLSGTTGGVVSVPGGVSEGDLKTMLKIPSHSDAKEQMAGTATESINGAVCLHLDMAGVG